VRPGRRSAIGIFQRSKSTAKLDGNVALGMADAVSRRRRCIDTRPSSADGVTPGICLINRRKPKSLQRPQQDDQSRHADLRPYRMKREPEGEMHPKPYSCTHAASRRSPFGTQGDRRRLEITAPCCSRHCRSCYVRQNRKCGPYSTVNERFSGLIFRTVTGLPCDTTRFYTRQWRFGSSDRRRRVRYRSSEPRR
jgi:hypothetical protein